MKMKTIWVVPLGFIIGLATNPIMAADDKKTDFEAEQAQIEKEDAAQKAERAMGIKAKYQRAFFGTVYILKQANAEISPDVVGYFRTNKDDMKPGRAYQMKMWDKSPEVLDALRRMHGKTVMLKGKLRLLDANGEAKYVMVNSVEELAPSPRVPERQSSSGL